jgi:hypothetical protein
MPLPPQQHQTIETQEDIQPDFEEEIEAIIEDKLACLCQERAFGQMKGNGKKISGHATTN